MIYIIFVGQVAQSWSLVTIHLNNPMNDCYFTNFSIYVKKEKKSLKTWTTDKITFFLWAIRRVKNIYVIQAVKKLYISHLQSHKYLFPHFIFSIYNFMSQWDCRYYTGVYTLFLSSHFYLYSQSNPILYIHVWLISIDTILYNIRTVYAHHTYSHEFKHNS